MATASLTLQVQSQGVDSATNDLEDLENQANQTEIAVGQLETIQLRPSGISSTSDQFRNLENQANQTNTAVGQLETGSQRLSSSMRGLSGATSNLISFLPSLGTAFGLAAAGLLALLTNAGSFRSELVRLADLSNTSVPEFQRISSAFKTLNIDMDKTADILKDVNDKVGDFVLTGGGEFKTIFEKVIKPLGKTREELTKLGPEGILLLVAEGLETIGANGQETTFILEALANDATLLVPLLNDNGQALKEISLAIEEKGLLLTESEVEALRIANKQLSEIEVTVTNIFTKTKGVLAEFIFGTADFVGTLEEANTSLASVNAKIALLQKQSEEDFFSNNAEEIDELTLKMFGLQGAIIRLTAVREQERKEEERAARGVARRAEEVEKIRKTEQDKIEAKREAEEQKVLNELERFAAKQMREQEQKEKELALERGFARRRLELILALNETEREAIERIRTDRLESLEVDLEKELISLSDFRAAKIEIDKNADAAEAELDRKSRETKEKELKASFSRISGLVQSSNKKIIAINQVTAVANAVIDAASAETKEQVVRESLSAISGLIQSSNKELFRIGQAAALANAVVETASAVSKALSAAAPPLSFFLAAAAAAAGAAQFATIASASPPSTRQQGGQFQAGQQLLVGEQGPELVEFGAGGRIASAQETKKIAGDKPSAPEIIIINQTSEEIAQPDVNIDEEQRIIILIRNTVSSDIENPNSRVSKSLNRNTTTSRQF